MTTQCVCPVGAPALPGPLAKGLCRRGLGSPCPLASGGNGSLKPQDLTPPNPLQTAPPRPQHPGLHSYNYPHIHSTLLARVRTHTHTHTHTQPVPSTGSLEGWRRSGALTKRPEPVPDLYSGPPSSQLPLPASLGSPLPGPSSVSLFPEPWPGPSPGLSFKPFHPLP